MYNPSYTYIGLVLSFISQLYGDTRQPLSTHP